MMRKIREQLVQVVDHHRLAVVQLDQLPVDPLLFPILDPCPLHPSPLKEAMPQEHRVAHCHAA